MHFRFALLEALRATSGLSSVEAAAAVGVTARTVRNWERGLSVPNAEQLFQLARIYRTPVNEFYRRQRAG